MQEAMEKTMAEGVAEKVIVHAKEAGLCLSRSGEFTVVPSLRIPVEEIRGSEGAGDAFCAGSLYGIYHGISDRELLEFASAAAACNLFAENAMDGMKNKEEIEQVMAAGQGRSYLDLRNDKVAAIRQAAEEKMRLFGCAGKA